MSTYSQVEVEMDKNVEDYIRAGSNAALERLRRLCAQPSVSAYGQGIHQCAQLVKEMLEELGAKVSLTPAPESGYPVIYGEIKGRSERTVLFYDHYDVQPPEPLELWTSPPFEPALREGRLYGRGVSDDKGSIAVRLAAVEAFVRAGGGLPCTVKFFLEGEEEIGSPHLGQVVRDHAQLLKADGCIWEGGGVNWDGNPTISLGLKGILYLELVVRGPNRDVHSSYAAVVSNPIWRLAWALAALKNPEEQILIPGFYDAIRPTTQAEMEALRRIPTEDQQLLDSLGLSRFIQGATGVEYQRRLQTEPTCNVCGIISGYTGEGTKTVLPEEARAKLDLRLVPDQDPQDIVRKIRSHLDAQGFEDVRIASWDGEPAARTPLDHPWVSMVAQAAARAYGRDTVLAPSMAGSGPMHLFTHQLGLPVSTGCGVSHPDNRIHAPNENIRVEDIVKGVLHAAELLEQVSTST